MLIVPSGMVVLQRITPSRLTPPNFSPVKSAPVKFVGGISELLVSLRGFSVTLLPSNPYQLNVVAITIIIKMTFSFYPLLRKLYFKIRLHYP
jgi:hypothetical protein